LKHRWVISIIGFCLILFLPSLHSQVKYTTEYRIGPKDLLEIRVFGLDELNTTARVSEDGKITLPLLGEVEVQGLTKGEVERKLGDLLEKNYLQNPQVTIFIREYQSKRIYINGAVVRPGPYELIGHLSLKQVISLAGGLTTDAGEEIIVTREDKNGKSMSLKISVQDLFLNNDSTFNLPLQPNDIVYVPPEEMVKIYVIGRVMSPGAFEVKKSNIPTLLRAIAQAGGFAERASKGGVIIKRIDENGRERTIKVNVKDIIKGKRKDIKLKGNDVVIVPETIF